MSDGRPAFRPQRARASLSALATSTTLPSEKENGSTTPALASTNPDPTAQKRKKRAQSLGGDALEGARKRLKEGGQDNTLTLELLPGRMDRRKAAPRRSILKMVPPLFTAPSTGRSSLGGNHTISFDSSRRTSLAPSSAQHDGAHTFDFSSTATTSNTAANGVSVSSTARRRSSLRPRTSLAAQSNYDDSDQSEEDEEDDPNGSMDMDVTRFETTTAYDGDGRRKSVAHDRRVSFAPAAHIRTYTPDKPTADAQAFAIAQAAALAKAQAEAGGDESFSSTSSAAFSDDGLAGEEDDLLDAAQHGALDDEPSMEISREMVEDSNLHLRFGGHFAGTNVPSGAFTTLAAAGGAEDESDVEDEDEDGTQAMDEVTSDVVTSAFAQFETNVFNSQQVYQRAQAEDAAAAASTSSSSGLYPSLSGLAPVPSSSAAPPAPAISFTLPSALPDSAVAAKPRPRFSVIARTEDDEDAEIMRSLGFNKGGKPRKSRIAFAGVQEDEEEDDEDEEEETESMSMEEEVTEAVEMDLTVAVGGVLSESIIDHHPELGQQGQDDTYDGEGDSDAEVSMQLTNTFAFSGANQTVDMTFATEAGPRSSSPTVSEAMEEATATMLEATTYGGILSQSLLSRPGDLFAADERRRSASPAALSVAARAAASPPKSSGRALRGTTPTLAAAVGAQSPFRRTLAPSSPLVRRQSPLPSPRRVAASPAPEPKPQQAPPPPRRSLASALLQSPVKGAPPSSLAAPKSPQRGRTSVSPVPPPVNPLLERSRARTSRSRSRSASPAKPTAQQQQQREQSLLATPGKAIFNPRTLAPPQSAGRRSPGGSLSLRALLGAGGESPAKGAAGGGDGGEGEDLTGSEFDQSFGGGGGEALPAPPASLEAFFGATGVSFVDDILDLAGVDLAQGRRKSVAPTPGRGGGGMEEEEREPAGPPTFADMAVAGACKSLFYQLYQSDQLRLQEGIRDAQHIYVQQEEAIQAASDADKPRVFRDWANASEEVKGVMRSQFRQIKLYYLLQGQLEWKECRRENYSQILQVMEQNLEGLKEDRAALTALDADFATVIPSLEERHAALQADLLAERALDAELSSYSEEDQEFLRNLWADAEEQDEQLAGAPSKSIPGRRPELDRITQQLASYRDTLVRYTTDEAALQREIAALEERRRDKRTKADLVRLRGEYEALQSVQGWKLVGFDTKEVRMRHWGEFDVSFLLQPSNGGGGGKRLRVGAVEFDLRIDENAREGQGLKAQATAFLLAKVRDEVERVLAEEGGKDIRDLLRYISSRCVVLRHIRSELSLCSLLYPTTARLITPPLSSSVSSSSSHASGPTLEVDISLFHAPSRQGFSVLLPLTAAEVLDPLTPEDWARGLSASVRPRFGGKGMNALGMAQGVNERLEGGEGRGAVVEAVREAERELEREMEKGMEVDV